MISAFLALVLVSQTKGFPVKIDVEPSPQVYATPQVYSACAPAPTVKTKVKMKKFFLKKKKGC